MGQKKDIRKNKGCGKIAFDKYLGEKYDYICDEYHLCNDCKNEEKQKTL